MPGPLYVHVDWGKDGTFAAAPAADDVTDRVRGTVTVRYGRDANTPSRIAAGTGTFNLDNRSKDYSPRNSSSPLFGNLKPARPVRIQRVVGATTYTLFRGHTDDNPIDPDLNTKQVTLNLVDHLGDFNGVTITTPLYQGVRSGAVVNAILDAVGWTGGRDIDAGASVFPYWWADGADAYDELGKVLASEGPPALLSIGTSGEVIFRDRHHRLTRSTSTTSQATFRSTYGLGEPVMQPGMKWSGNWGSVVNSVTLSVDERRPDGNLSRVWETQDTITIGASASYVVVVQASEPFLGAVAPTAAAEDFTVVSGSVTSTSVSRTSGKSTSITITAGGSGATITGMALRAYSVPVARTVQVSATDATSISDYGARGLPSGADPVWCNRYDAQSIANLWVLTRKQPPALITARFVVQHTQTSKLNALLALDLSERVTVIEAETSTNGPFYVESIQHTIEDMTEHVIEITLEEVPSSPTNNQFILGTSTLNGSDVLGY